MADLNFEARFNAFAAEAQAVKDEAVERMLTLLKEADLVIAELRAKGIYVRAEMPGGMNQCMADMRFICEFSRKL